MAVSLLFIEVVVAPPFVFLSLVKSLLRSDFAVAAQNAWVKKGGAFTGETRCASPPCHVCFAPPTANRQCQAIQAINW